MARIPQKDDTIMPNERDERENAPKFQIIDNRLLSDEERSGKSSGESEEQQTERPKLEIIGGGASAPTEEPELDEEEFDEEGELSEEEMEQMRSEMEAEQFAAIEEQVGRKLTEEEKVQVRAEMERQAQTMSRLEVTPILLQTIAELPRFAAVHLGLIANPYTRLIARNDTEARLAIDAFGALYDVLKTRVDARTGAELARVLNDLRSNYTRVTGINPTAPTDGPRIIR